LLGVAGAALLFPAISSDSVAGDPIAGQGLAKQWCVSCHDIGQGRTVKDGAPSFVSVARRPDITPKVLKTWLADPHPPMPKLSLSRQEIDDLVSYIGSLK
jgi:mono/diheme cytochrome c family protein